MKFSIVIISGNHYLLLTVNALWTFKRTAGYKNATGWCWLMFCLVLHEEFTKCCKSKDQFINITLYQDVGLFVHMKRGEKSPIRHLHTERRDRTGKLRERQCWIALLTINGLPLTLVSLMPWSASRWTRGRVEVWPGGTSLHTVLLDRLRPLTTENRRTCINLLLTTPTCYILNHFKKWVNSQLEYRAKRN